jgi:hypothetical protein
VLLGGDVRFTVVESWEAAYPDPIRLKRGDVVHLTDRRDVWDGHVWLWAKSSSGREGWIPDSLIDPDAATPVAAEDYDATELTCQIGDIVVAQRLTHGWAHCRQSDGRTGWVPQKNLVPAVE